jgi:hypothetical protein
MMSNSVARFRGHETVGRNYIWKLCEEVRDALRSGEKVGCERSKLGIRRGWQDDGRRGRRIGTENPLVGHIKQEVVMFQKICTQDWNGYRSCVS